MTPQAAVSPCPDEISCLPGAVRHPYLSPFLSTYATLYYSALLRVSANRTPHTLEAVDANPNQAGWVEAAPAMNDTTGFCVPLALMKSAASSSAVPPISPIMMMPSVCRHSRHSTHSRHSRKKQHVTGLARVTTLSETQAGGKIQQSTKLVPPRGS